MRRRPFIVLSVLAALALGAIAWAERGGILIWLAPEKSATAETSDQAKRANARFWDALHGGRYDARLEQEGWDRPGFDDSAWARPGFGNGSKGTIDAARAPPIRVTRTLAACFVAPMS